MIFTSYKTFDRFSEPPGPSSPAGRRAGKFLRFGMFLALIGFTMTGCGVAVVGLRPLYPPLEKKSTALYAEFVEVDSLQPTFQWQPFPRTEDHLAGKVENVTYELRVWSAIPRPSGQLMYARNGLKSPSHQLTVPLEPASKYLWSVRARFNIDHRLRVTEWGMAGVPLRNEVVANQSCFRFKTPAAP